MTVTSCVRAHALFVRAQKHTIRSRFGDVAVWRSRCLRPHSRAFFSVEPVPPPPPPPKPPSKGTDKRDQPGDGSGGPRGAFVLIVLCVYVALFPTERAIAVESLPLDNREPSTGPLELGGASEGPKDDIKTVKRLLRDLFMEQLSLRKRQDAFDQPSQQVNALVDTTTASALRRRWKFMERIDSDAVVTISHNLELQGGYMSSSADGHNVLPSLHTGPRLHSRIHSQLDTEMHISARTMASAAGISLWQAQLQRVLWDKVTILMSPVGARFKDIAQSLHASKGEGLLEATCEGPPLHSAIHTCGAGARVEHSALSLSAAVFGDVEPDKSTKGSIAPAGDGVSSTVCSSSAVQMNCAVSRTLSIGGLWAHRNSLQGDSLSAPFEVGSGAEAEAEAPAPSSLRSVLPAALAGPAVQRCDHCTRGVVAAWDTEAGVVASAYWLGGAKAAPPHSSSGSADEERTGSGDRDESAGWRRGLSQLQSAAAMGVQVATHPTDDGTTLQFAAHVLPELTWQPKQLVMEASARVGVGKGCFMQMGAVASRKEEWSGALLAKMDLFW